MGKVDIFGEFKSEFDPHPDTEKSKGKRKCLIHILINK